MHTRGRDYVVNPRSPPKRRNRVSKREKEVQGLVSPTNPPKTRIARVVSYRYYPTTDLTKRSLLKKSLSIPDLTTLPPLPPSPSETPATPHLDILPPIHLSSLTPHTHRSSTNSSESSTETVPILTPQARDQDNNNIGSPSKTSSSNSLSELQEIISRLHIADTSTTETSRIMNQDQDRFAMEEINQATKVMANVTTFPPLSDDGSNFVQWKKNTARAMKELVSIKNYWDTRQPLTTYVDRARDRLANMVISKTIHNDLKDVTDDSDSAYDAMIALQRHFRRGGRTNQFSLFNRLIHLGLDLNETEMITHMSTIDAIVSELESTGFTWSSESVRGLLYQLHMPAEMTKEINKELDAKFDDNSANFNINDVKGAIQMYLAREKTATETINISNLTTSVDRMSINATKVTPYTHRNAYNTPRSVNTQRQTQPSFNSTPRYTQQSNVKDNSARWRQGPPAWTKTDTERVASEASPIPIPNGAVSGVRSNLLQCFFCGAFGHSYRQGTCTAFEGTAPRSAAHWNDWRKAVNGKMYSLNVLYPNKYSRPGLQLIQQHSSTPHSVNAVEVKDQDSEDKNQTLQVSSLTWSSEGYDECDVESVPTEYLFDGGATDAVSNNREILLNYQTLPTPIPIQTATNDSKAVIIGKGELRVDSDNGNETIIQNVYYCPKATGTIISPGALISRGAKMVMNGNDYSIKLTNGSTIRAVHKNRRWFIRARNRLHRQQCNGYVSTCSLERNSAISQLWHSRLGHVSMKRIKKLFKDNDEYGLPKLNGASDVTCEHCLQCKSTRRRILSPTHREPRLLDVIVTDVAGPFMPCITGEKLIVTFRDVATSFSEICIIKQKSEVPARIMNIIKRWERETGVKTKTLRSDRGGEYIGATLETWLRQEGINHEFSNPHEPEQNGNAERLNRTLGDMARTMLSASKLPKTFWNYAYLTAAYLHNRIPNSITGEKTPYELFFNKKPQLDIIRTFGATAFVHIHRGQRAPGKLEDRGRKCIMIGYVNGGKGWLFYDPMTKSTFASAIAQFPYEEKLLKNSINEALKSTPPQSQNKDAAQSPTNKGSLQHIINALKLGDFTEEIKLDRQDVAATHALSGDDYLKLLRPPRSYNEAMKSAEAMKWKEACDKEMEMMDKMKVWKVVDRPNGLVPIGLKWVFAYKQVDDNGNPIKFKARLVAKGFSQQEGINYTETFAPTATFAGLRIMLTIAAIKKWPVHSFDITSAYLHSAIDSKVYFSLPTGYLCEARKAKKILEAMKALYGTKQGARCWWKHFDSILTKMGFKCSQYDQSLYIYRRGSDTCIIWLHSDDGGVTGSSEELLFEISDKLKKDLLIKWEPNLEQIVGVKVTRDIDGSFRLSQPGLTKKIIQAFLPDERTAKTPMNLQKIPNSPDEGEERIDNDKYLSAIGSLNYLSVATRPDITYTVNYLARFSADPRKQHWAAIEHVIRYLNTSGVTSLLIKPLRSKVSTPIQTYVDANWGGEGSRSTHGFITYFLNCPIAWTSKRQTCVATSTCHAEYMAMGTACRDAVWLRNLIGDLTGEENIVDMHCDNTSAIHVASDNSSNKRTRHTDREFYYVNEQIFKGRIFLHWIDTKSQRADILTKPLGPTLHQTGLSNLRISTA